MLFSKSYDVVVVGGGVAGVAAALEAARSGMRTALVEKTVFPGGLATTGLIWIYLPLCDGQGTQVTFGLAEELLLLSLKYGPGDVPANWRKETDAVEEKRYRVVFSPAAFMLALDEVLTEAGVDIWYDTLFCLPVMQGDVVTGIEVENKSGRGRLLAACVIDATGDADVATRAGAPTAEQDNWLSFWALQASLDAACDAVKKNDGTDLVKSIALGGGSNGENVPNGCRKWFGTDGRQVSRFVLEGRKLLREYYQQLQQEHGSDIRRDIFPVTLPAMAQFRTTRRIDGVATLVDNQQWRHFDDAIGVVADWRKAGSVWEIPYGTLVPRNIRGLLAAGRCISSSGDAWEVTRVIPAAALTGQAAGAAATLAVQGRTTPDRLDYQDVQRAMRTRGNPVHINEIAAYQTSLSSGEGADSTSR